MCSSPITAGRLPRFCWPRPQTSATFTGQDGHTYAFFSVATDNVGHVEAAKTTAEASTLIQAQTTTTIVLASDHAAGSTYGQAVTFTATVAPSSSAFGVPTGSVQFRIDGSDFGVPVALIGGVASVTTAVLSAGSHEIAAVYTSDTSNFGNSTTPSPLIQTVSPAPLTIAADDKARLYGGTQPDLRRRLQRLCTRRGAGRPDRHDDVHDRGRPVQRRGRLPDHLLRPDFDQLRH